MAILQCVMSCMYLLYAFFDGNIDHKPFPLEVVAQALAIVVQPEEWRWIKPCKKWSRYVSTKDLFHGYSA